ncbi:hypothetical protein [Hazenella coriacea]|uniref:Tetratricopeptide repeat protein n=1 Tax=Hazenella coriacea TaxID=1179467 RepID=A0A4R3LC12_9BACL|nr:hypothetical protein [Hazenella coriacea]TCS95854.1 hypothetical protein EDD58_102436 [Hazenella coriacea]
MFRRDCLSLRNSDQNRYLELMNVLGSIYLLEKKYNQARQCFQTVLDYDHEFEYPRRQIDALTYLVILQAHDRKWSEDHKNIERAIEMGRTI